MKNALLIALAVVVQASTLRAATPMTFDQAVVRLAERHAQSRDVWMTLLTEGIESGALKSDLDLELAYRFIRDTIWVAVRWYRPGGELSHVRVAQQYLSILLDGIAA